MAQGTDERRAGDVLQPHTLEAVYGLAVRVLAHPVTGRPIVVPESVAVDAGTQRRTGVAS
jgi:ABC-type hemin transport system ATPase subunit